MILVTGGAGFIGSNFVIDWLKREDEGVINLDALTYAGNIENLGCIMSDTRHFFVQGDICDTNLIEGLLSRYRPRAIINFAAESHVDRSIGSPNVFLHTNVEGTFSLLDASRKYWNLLSSREREKFRFVHVSTDEVFGSLGPDCSPFIESSLYKPSSPYSASKAASNHFVQAWQRTYGLPVLITNCSNNYGPYQFPEKLIPLIISSALKGRSLPIYGDGMHVRDWLYVTDHCNALSTVLELGVPGETYNIGGGNEMANIEVVTMICDLLDIEAPSDAGSYRRLVTYVADRPGHDRRYAIDASKITHELGWRPQVSFESGLRRTIQWYLANMSWVENIHNGIYQQMNYQKRKETP